MACSPFHAQCHTGVAPERWDAPFTSAPCRSKCSTTAACPCRTATMSAERPSRFRSFTTSGTWRKIKSTRVTSPCRAARHRALTARGMVGNAGAGAGAAGSGVVVWWLAMSGTWCSVYLWGVGRGLELPRLTFVLYKARPRRHPLPKSRPGLPGRPGEACVCVGGRGERM